MNEYRKLSRHTKKIVRHDDEEYLSVAKFRTNQKEDYLGEHALSKYNNGKDKNLHQAELERVFMRDQVSIGLMMRLNTFSRSYVANIIRNVMNSSVITQKYFDKIHKEYNSAYFLAKAESLFTNAEIPDEVFASILKEHHKQLCQLSIDEIIETLDKTKKFWERKNSYYRRKAKSVLTKNLSFSTEMIEEGLKIISELFKKD